MADESILDSVDFELPPERIAQLPTERREDARLLVGPRAGDPTPEHRHVRDLPSLLRAGDLLVVNTTRVVPARLRGRKTTGGAAEALLLGPEASDAGGSRFRALVRFRGKLKPGVALCFEGRNGEKAEAHIEGVHEGGEATLAFDPDAGSPYALGEAPLPPYIERSAGDPRRATDDDRYQTVFAREPGAVAAPTAGLHLSEALLGELDEHGIERAEVVLHVGIGTFRPPRPEDLAADRLHAETFDLPERAARQIAATRERGGRVIAIGTTSARVLETRARDDGGVDAGRGETTLLLRPGSRFRAIDGLLTNFHLPRSSLLLLVSAFAGRERVLGWYREAIDRQYRFYSYGDAMLIL